MTTAAPRNIVEQIDCLPALPAIAQQVLSVTNSDKSSAQDVARVLRSDPIIAARILRVANSPFYGATRQITQLSRAVTRLGSTAVRNLVMGICAKRAFGLNSMQREEHERFWQHAIAVAATSELLAKQIRFHPAEEAFVAGLLHDVGHLAMLTLEPELYRTILAQVSECPHYLELERQYFGVDHAETGYRVMNHWGLPDELCQVPNRHHQSDHDLDQIKRTITAIVLLADTITHIEGFGVDRPVGSLYRSEWALSRLNLNKEALHNVLSILEDRVEEANDMLEETYKGKCVDPPSKNLPKTMWMMPEKSSHSLISEQLLERRGYNVQKIAVSAFDLELQPDNMVLIEISDDHEPDEINRLISRLKIQNINRIVLLMDHSKDMSTSRAYDRETGIYRIPRLFTAFDICWIEEHILK